MTGKVLWHVTMSLDGFIADADDGLAWGAGHTTKLADEAAATMGAGLSGRRTYDVNRGAKAYGVWSGPDFVLTHEPPAEPDPGVTFLTGDLAAAVDTARAAAGEKNVVLFGANLGQHCVTEGLVDEILVHLVPVLLGDGVRLFHNPGGKPCKLERIELGESGQLTDLRFRPVRN